MKTKLLLLLAFLGLTGCASLIDGTEQNVTFDSNPTGADVLINGVRVGKTPLTLKLKKESKTTLVVRKEGYKDFTAPINTSVNPWIFGNIIIGGLPGTTTDAASGALNRYDPDSYMATLEKAD